MVTVSKAEVEQLATETMMLKEFLPKLLTPDLLSSVGKLAQKEQGRYIITVEPSNISPSAEVWVARKEREEREKELEHLRRRNESLKAEFEQEKQVIFLVLCLFVVTLLCQIHTHTHTHGLSLLSLTQEKFASKVCSVYSTVNPFIPHNCCVRAVCPV